LQAILGIQNSTKVMQHICAHGKIKTDKRVRERQRERETDRQTDRDRDRDRKRDRDRQTDRQKERERQRQAETDTEPGAPRASRSSTKVLQDFVKRI